ncbi:sugar transferase [Pseudomonas sessilinigenes]|uniref:Sugar transferase n=2 Tax=Pseudomonas sessilinigenes TaxID=658629 RepID=A0ABX8MJB6_9PSED|nr:sugar transferase [Pseudomonas sessilinigenes]
MKRLIDVVFSALGLLLLSPLMVITYLLVRYYLGGPVLFRQVRPGFQGKPFEMLKFRTMLDGVDANGVQLPDSERLTKFGRFLRSSSLDELPGLINVLKGDMSIVGPRPLLMSYLPLYSTEQNRRHLVRPGVTGLAQVSGRNSLSWEEKFRLDVWYVDNQSLVLDLKIIFLTFKKVFLREGINQEGQATMEAFKGSTDNAIDNGKKK